MTISGASQAAEARLPGRLLKVRDASDQLQVHSEVSQNHYALTQTLSQNHYALTQTLSQNHYALTQTLSQNHYALTQTLSQNHYALTQTLSQNHYALTQTLSQNHYALTQTVSGSGPLRLMQLSKMLLWKTESLGKRSKEKPLKPPSHIGAALILIE